MSKSKGNFLSLSKVPALSQSKGSTFLSQSKGFTLIELLVVIAIIGILSSVVLASLNTARGKAANAAIKADLANIRGRAELVYDSASPNSYATACADARVVAMLAHAQTTNGGTATFCYSVPASYVAASALKVADGTNIWWCVDNSGNSKGATAAVSGTPATCP